jgi:predicted permease
VIAYAIDVMTGSELTKLSLLGPNPIFGVRFYGIGNELEALIAVMVPVGVGAGLTAAGEERHRRAVLAFLGVGAIAAVIFAAGRFGADVGAAVVLTVGAAVPAALTSGTRRNLGVAAVAAPLVALGALALIDLISGGDSHLTRSVLDAGGAGDLADIAQRRLELSAHDFAQAAGNPLFWAVILGIGLAIWKWRRIDAWLRPAPYARAGVIGACAAVAVGVLFNDSGATFLVLGSLALGAAFAFAWAQAQTDP